MNLLTSPFNRAVLIAIIAVIIGVFSYFSVVQPETNDYNVSAARLQQDQTTYDELKSVADQRPLYLALTKQIQSRLSGVELTADPRSYIPSYLKQVENLAQNDGLQVTSVTPQATPSPSPGASAAPVGASNGPATVAHTVPVIGQAAQAVGSESAQSQVTSGVAATTEGATPVPGAPGAPIGPGAPGAAKGGPVAGSARANAIAYLNQSFSQVPINMELSGTYTQFEKFLRDLNKFPKLIGVGNVTLTPGSHQDVGETPTLTIVLPIVAYRLSPGAGQTMPQALPGNVGPAAPGRNGG
jgi:Tfp pilus assembly protein PilO